MVWRDKVVWQEGMFLRAQHFQQQDRHLAHQLQSRTAPLRPHPWGLTELSLDRDLLVAGRFAVNSASGVLEDGTPFSIPATADAPVPLDLPDGTRNAVIYLALPLAQEGSPEVALTEDPSQSVRARFGIRTFSAFDTHSDSPISAEVTVGRPRLRYLLETDDRAGFTCLGLARIVEVQADRRVQLDDRFIPASLDISASTVLTNLVAELDGMLGQRADALAAQLGQPVAGGVGDVRGFLMLQVMNRWQPLFSHWSRSSAPHPEALYRALAQLTGELATFTTPGRRAADYPPYRHDDLQRSFAPVVADLRRSLSVEVERNAIAIPLRAPNQYDIRVGAINDRSLLRASQFVLTVSADMPGEQLRRLFPKQAKVAAVEQIAEVVNAGISGIDLRTLPVAPPQVRFHAGAIYFELDRGSPYWNALNTSGGFAIHVSSDDFPNLRLELWAIRA